MSDSLEKHIRQIYSRAGRELSKKTKSFFAHFEDADNKKRRLVEEGKLTEKEYQKWRTGQLMTGERFKQMQKDVANAMLDANRTAADYVNGKIDGVYASNFNRVGRDAAKQVPGYSFDLVSPTAVKRLTTKNETLLPYKHVDGKKDERWNTKQVNGEILQGIIQGESIPNIAKRLENVVGMNKDSAVRNARTAMTGAENAGRFDGMRQLEEDGVIMKKEWVAAIDSHTREAHLELDGQQVDVDEPFVVDIEVAKGKFIRDEIMYPGDPNAHPANVYNCRCSLKTVVVGFKRQEKEQLEEQAKSGPTYSIKGMKEPVRPYRSDFDDDDTYYAARDEYRAQRDEFNKQMDEIVKKALENPRFETNEDFTEWAGKNEIHLDDDFTSKIDLRTMNETSRALDEMFERFPEAKSFEFFDFDGTKIKPGFALMSDDDGFMSCRGGIAFNPKRFSNFENALQDALYSAMSGETVMGDGTFATMIRHEYGHQVESYIKIHVIGRDGIQGLDDWRGHFPSLEAYRSACRECVNLNDKYTSELRALFNLDGASEYSNQDLRELFAEGFAEWTSGGKSEFANKFGEFFGRWYK